MVPSTRFLVASLSMLSLGITGCGEQRDDVQAQERPNIQTPSVDSSRTGADVRALVALGPRVTGTPAIAKASAYLSEQYRRAGYVAEVQTFTYPKFEDLGSSLSVGGRTLAGQALNGSQAGNPTAPLVAVPNLGRSEDFAGVNVKGAIAIVRRGEIRFLEKAQNAAAAGAIGLVIVNTAPGNVFGTLGDGVSIPVLALAGDLGRPWLEQAVQQASLVVNTRQRRVTGRNVVAHLPGVTQPSLVLGGHYDSVAGSPGANDNASGTAVVLAIARNVARTPLAGQTWFVAFDGEEDGLHGSRAFVNAATPQFRQRLKGMLNFDMVGVNSQLGVGGSESLTSLARLADSKVSTFRTRGGSDHAPFAGAGVPVLFFYRGQEPNYHSPNDRLIDPRLLDQTAQAGISVVQRLIDPNPGVVSR